MVIEDEEALALLLKYNLEKEGYEVLCIFDGLGQNPEIQKMYVEHVKAAIGEK